MEFKEIMELIKTVDSSSLTQFEIERDGLHIKMQKETGKMQPLLNKKVNNVQNQEEENVKVFEDETESGSNSSAAESDLYEVKSPIVGTFYASAGPDAKSYVEVGSRVKKGDVLCIIEAMKLMNEIESDVDGTIVNILPENEAMVEYDQVLFKIKPEKEG